MFGEALVGIDDGRIATVNDRFCEIRSTGLEIIGRRAADGSGLLCDDRWSLVSISSGFVLDSATSGRRLVRVVRNNISAIAD
jgi:hypothetical protein